MFTRHFAAALTRACAGLLVLLALASQSLAQEAKSVDPSAPKADTPATSQPPSPKSADAAPSESAPSPTTKPADEPLADSEPDVKSAGAKASGEEPGHKDDGPENAGHKKEGPNENGREGQDHEKADGDSGHKEAAPKGDAEAGHNTGADGDHKAGEGIGHEATSHAKEHNDPGHGNAAAGLEAPEEYKWDLAIYSFIVFVMLLAILFRFAWGPIMEGLDKREAAVADNIRLAEANAAKSEQILRDHEAKLAEAAEETKTIIDKAKADAERSAQRIVEQAEEAAARERERAIADIETAKSSALAELSEKSVDIALGLAGGIVRKNLDRELHADLIRDALDQFPSEN